jgi:hypothetical protein
LFFNEMLVVSAALSYSPATFVHTTKHVDLNTSALHWHIASHSSWSWMFVYAFEMQILLLLKAWERLFQNVHVLAGSIVACACNFLIAMAFVVEFQFDGSAQTKIGHRG